MALLTKEAILAADDLPSEIVPVPEWGGEVKVRSISGKERDGLEAAISAGKKVDLSNIRARLVALSVVGEDGKPLFAPADVEALGGKSAKALDRVFDVAQRLSGLRKEDVEDLVKNSASGPELKFYYRLCLALGYPHPDILLASLSSAQIAGWMAFYTVEPWGIETEDLRSGIVASTMANCHRDPKRNAYTIKDFMPRWDNAAPGDPDKLRRQFAALAQWAQNSPPVKVTNQQEIKS